ncbi:MAG: hypothetical protein GF334_10615 [Candidatus Altiarchaeales archaeon]|nr:hypothetical protein [Candidatus Altiarchaeales archaeon]
MDIKPEQTNYLLISAVAGLALLVVFFSWYSIPYFDFILVFLGVAGGLIASYILYHYFTSEKKIPLAEGEEILIDATHGRDHLLLSFTGEESTPQQVISADLYLTNLGVLASDPLTEQTMLYIPLDRIHQADIVEGGLKLSFMAETGDWGEAVLYPQTGFDFWAQKIHESLTQTNPQ